LSNYTFVTVYSGYALLICTIKITLKKRKIGIGFIKPTYDPERFSID